MKTEMKLKLKIPKNKETLKPEEIKELESLVSHNQNTVEDIVLNKPLETHDDFERKMAKFEELGVDEIREIAKENPLSKSIENPEVIEKERDPVYKFMLKVMKGEITEDQLNEKAKSNCNKCYGRGHKGYQLVDDSRIPVVCKCVLKAVKKEDAKVAVDDYQNEIEEAVDE